MPPLIIFEGKRLNSAWVEVPGPDESFMRGRGLIFHAREDFLGFHIHIHRLPHR